jgi:osmotically-inducible protein OsmY
MRHLIVNRMKSNLTIYAFATALSLSLFTEAAIAQEEATAGLDARQQELQRISREVQRQILRLPQYGVFDALHFAIKGDTTIVLRGYASRPTLKSSAENVVKKIEGVKQVENDIEVLPLSPNDDRIREAVYNAIYGFGSLQRYTANRGGAARMQRNSMARRSGGITNDPPIGWHAIHIIVKNGNVTLTGVVDNEGDFAIAGMRANQVAGVFSVDNDLQIAAKG